MTRLLLSLAFLFIAIGPATGQGTIRGKMTDAQTGETLIGANVVIKEPYKGAMADIDGNYELDGLSPGTYMVTGSFIGYTPITETVEVGEGVTILNFNLYVETFVIEQAAEVVAKVDRSRDVYMENIKKKSASSMDFISSQQIKQTGDSDAAGAIKRVPGVSTVGNFVFVRGLSDRYIKTTLNGAEVPSMNPRRNSIEMDLFPTNLVDNLMIVKTQTADLPGDWAGAYISIETKDFPEEFTLNYSTTVGFNDQTTFRNVLASNRGETDWMAFDDGQRGIPNYAQGLTQEDWPYQQSASFYDALIYLNFGSQLDTLYGGISQGGIGPGVGQVPIQEILSDLDYSDTSLVNLGGADGTYLLNQEGLIPVAELLNDSLTQLGQSFNNTWAVRQKQAPLNFSHSLSLGSQTKLFGRPLGYIFGLRWGQSSQHYENGEYGRYAGGSIEGTDSLGLERYYDDTRSDISHKWNALANLSYKVNEFNKISLMAMPNMSATASTRQQVGFNPRDTEEFQQQITHRYEGRELNIFQLRGEHFLPASETEIRWTASHSAGRLNTPDLRVFFNNFDTATVVTSTAFQGLDTTYTEDVMLDQINYLIGEGILGEDWANDPQGTVEELNAYWEDEGEDFSLERIDLETELDTSYSIQQSLYPSPTRYYRDLYENRTDVKLHVLQPLNLNGFDDVKLSGGVSLVRTTRSMQENQFGFEATSANFLDAFDGD
ncbi:MAG: carboxypeptidase-like regulatory domain-containing protein, partial [Flavobacteriales bacterium]